MSDLLLSISTSLKVEPKTFKAPALASSSSVANVKKLCCIKSQLVIGRTQEEGFPGKR